MSSAAVMIALWGLGQFIPFSPADQTNIFTNGVDPDETVSSGCTLFAILISIFDWHPYLQQWICQYSK